MLVTGLKAEERSLHTAQGCVKKKTRRAQNVGILLNLIPYTYNGLGLWNAYQSHFNSACLLNE